eukprot:CAMPEP_0185728580 /NCGR_PEP_ID=MMETSP1171-20130828/3915_1 /TAXON_ID=374046 /ORGANISM="Helicotheca tamensis, Strain CCMP826" /LENGTH=122 /DNA_ID=CAMNT_0028397305 /DNA_START=68 /DNA_END=433 /DNA_ORIENTATION=+
MTIPEKSEKGEAPDVFVPQALADEQTEDIQVGPEPSAPSASVADPSASAAQAEVPTASVVTVEPVEEPPKKTTVTTTTTTTTTTVVKTVPLGRNPQSMQCPFCKNTGTTRVEHAVGTDTLIW